MRAVVAIVAILAVLLLIGWVQYDPSDDNPNLELNTQKVKQDTATAVEKGKEVIEKVDREIREELNEEEYEVDGREIEVEPAVSDRS